MKTNNGSSNGVQREASITIQDRVGTWLNFQRHLPQYPYRNAYPSKVALEKPRIPKSECDAPRSSRFSCSQKVSAGAKPFASQLSLCFCKRLHSSCATGYHRKFSRVVAYRYTTRMGLSQPSNHGENQLSLKPLIPQRSSSEHKIRT